ncbi:cache domain-containing protein [Noviherbaspirillum galbum]|uniref:Single Cache domain-containing protein n=1 Tax=Noviherbaspirillum galbum TaxID=2709383 RepID=A0A6B3SJR2_9BURK|nr:cache domain-containing protein [Noviherbaspirillum galbum]NEX61094.1 hypothetical protein [Noviherbaspirillum galbum]
MKNIQMPLAAAALALISATGFAADAPSQKEAEVVAIVKKAVAHLKAKGVDAACKDFADPAKGFQSAELYLFVEDMNATMICNIANAKLNGKSMKELKDSNGKAFNKDLIEVAQKKGSGWVDYVWVNPANQKLQPKSSYVEGTGDYMVGMGIFKDK